MLICTEESQKTRQVVFSEIIVTGTAHVTWLNIENLIFIYKNTAADMFTITFSLIETHFMLWKFSSEFLS